MKHLEVVKYLVAQHFSRQAIIFTFTNTNSVHWKVLPVFRSEFLNQSNFSYYSDKWLFGKKLFNFKEVNTLRNDRQQTKCSPRNTYLSWKTLWNWYKIDDKQISWSNEIQNCYFLLVSILFALAHSLLINPFLINVSFQLFQGVMKENLGKKWVNAAMKDLLCSIYVRTCTILGYPYPRYDACAFFFSFFFLTTPSITIT